MPTPDDLRLYEAMFLVDTGDAAAWDDLAGHLEGVLGRVGAEVIGITRWDERKLAYPIGKHKRGTYVLVFFALSDGMGVAEIEHACQLSEKVLRLLVLRADHFKVRDMRAQLGEDIREDLAARLVEIRGETEMEESDAKADAEPVKAKADAEPAKAPAEPAQAPAEPAKAPAEPAESPAEPAKAGGDQEAASAP